MRVLNPNNLPEVLVRAVIGDYDKTPKSGRMSVTDLINPPWIRRLKIKHWDELEENVDDMAWSLFGKAFHDLMDKYSPDEGHSEHKLEYYVEPFMLVGMPDLHSGGIVDDYKVTSVWSFIYGDKPEWESQLNLYAWLLRKHGIEVKGLRIIAILRDWVKTKLIEPDYPRSTFHVVSLPLWSDEDATAFILGRIKLHLEDAPCTPEDMWQKETTYAVIKEGAKRAARVLPTMEDAIKWREDDLKRDYDIVERPGEKIRCKLYCPVRKVCPRNNEERHSN